MPAIKKPLHALNLQEKFCYFLRHAQALTPEQVALLIKDTPVMAKAFRALNRAYWSDEELQMYENQEKKEWDYRSAEYQRGIDEGKEKGIQLGEKRGKQAGIKEGIQLGKQEGRQDTLSALVKKGIISQQQADDMVKEHNTQK